MTKPEFLSALGDKLPLLSREDRQERLRFYAEMIDDRMEEGFSEEEAVAAVGTAEEIAAQILGDLLSAADSGNPPVKKKRLTAMGIVLLVLGAPLWLPLLVAAFAVILALYISWWSVIISLWAVFGSVAGCCLGGILGGAGLLLAGKGLSAMALIAAGIFCAGLAIFLFFGCKWVTKKTALATRNCFLNAKQRFSGKEEL